ncbi:hypothetical protein AJ79_05127 [Helicocarpus griseus UAMH5409]|uniref:Aminoglycoside phosphotransferase domain-containing protein n=1 Tax=Helicocarpus griseus UAMH5409 TaxID=1447875 RepID=A0A2B7XP83_9EURO|nr:hypothetical protein AJ79_05127 [Helicocarpus griseus UAMH5409]
MVRIPLLPRLAFTEEKLRGEIATMKYIAEKTTIPIPRLHGYSVTQNNILGLPFMLVEYIEAKPLQGTPLQKLDESKKTHLYSQLANIYVQLFHQLFDRIGALTLDENDGKRIFSSNRPLNVDVNDQEVGGLDICRHLSSKQSFASTIDYIYFIVKLIFNDFYRGRDFIHHRDDAQNYLYSIHMSQSILMEWVKPELNHGPFIPMHGDFRPSNILVDDDFSILSVLDWEWSHTVPGQMFVPPFWLADTGVMGIGSITTIFPDIGEASAFAHAAHEQEYAFYNGKRPWQDLPIAKLWPARHDDLNLFIAHGLLQPHCFGNVYWNRLDSHYYGEDSKERVKAFFDLKIRKSEAHAAEQKCQETKGNPENMRRV